MPRHWTPQRRHHRRRDRCGHDSVPDRGPPGLLAGTAPGKNESAGKTKSSKTRPGNPYLQGALGTAAMACAQNPATYLGARYRRIATRRGPQKANVAIQRSILTAIWHMATTGTLYDDPGADYFSRLHPERAKNRELHQLKAMGYKVTLDRTG